MQNFNLLASFANFNSIGSRVNSNPFMPFENSNPLMLFANFNLLARHRSVYAKRTLKFFLERGYVCEALLRDTSRPLASRLRKRE